MINTRNRPCGTCAALHRELANVKQQLAERTRWDNPIPVGNAIVPVDGGVLLIKRGRGFDAGELALPGGYMERGRTWQEEIARELVEETGIVAAGVDMFHVETAESGNLIVFGIVRTSSPIDVHQLIPTPEARSYTVARAPMELVWPTHRNALRAYFATRNT